MFRIICCANSSDLLTSSNPARTYFLYLYGRLGFLLLLCVNLLARGSRRQGMHVEGLTAQTGVRTDPVQPEDVPRRLRWWQIELACHKSRKFLDKSEKTFPCFCHEGMNVDIVDSKPDDFFLASTKTTRYGHQVHDHADQTWSKMT